MKRKDLIGRGLFRSNGNNLNLDRLELCSIERWEVLCINYCRVVLFIVCGFYFNI